MSSARSGTCQSGAWRLAQAYHPEQSGTSKTVEHLRLWTSWKCWLPRLDAAWLICLIRHTNVQKTEHLRENDLKILGFLLKFIKRGETWMQEVQALLKRADARQLQIICAFCRGLLKSGAGC